MSKSYVFTCEICERERDDIDVYGIPFTTSVGGLREMWQDHRHPETSDIHICNDCLQAFRDPPREVK